MPKHLHLQEHDELFWQVLDAGIRGPVTLVNIDAHSDMSMFDGTLGIGNFISKLVDLGIVNRVVWIKGPQSIDFDDGSYTFKVGKHGKALVSSLPEPYFFFQGSYAKVEKGRTVRFDVLTEEGGLRIEDGERWILSVDYDYFACANPCHGDLERMVAILGKETLGALYVRGRMIKSHKEWQEFAGTIESLAPGVLTSVVRCMFPQYCPSEDEISQRVLALAKVIRPKGCEAIYSVSSLSTGFTDASRHDFVGQRVGEWLGMLSKG